MEKKDKKIDYSVRLMARVHQELCFKLKSVTALLEKEKQKNRLLIRHIKKLEEASNQLGKKKCGEETFDGLFRSLM